MMKKLLFFLAAVLCLAAGTLSTVSASVCVHESRIMAKEAAKNRRGSHGLSAPGGLWY